MNTTLLVGEKKYVPKYSNEYKIISWGKKYFPKDSNEYKIISWGKKSIFLKIQMNTKLLVGGKNVVS